MRKFRELLEAPQTIVFAFGRFNPPTTGHEKLINKVKSVAGNVPYRVYPSFTTNPKKDPLPHALKVAYMRKMFPKHRKNIIADKNAKTAIMIAEMLFKEGYKNLIMVAGSDRVKEFSTLLNRYNDAPDKKGKQLFKFDSVQVISAGERDPDAEGVEGMSASKMRAAATDGDKDAFLTGLPKGFKVGEKLYRDVRKYMGIREERDMGDMSDFETVRDMYLTGKIWNAGDIVEAKGLKGEVVRKGTNYLSFMTEDGKVHKAWLHEITLDEGIRASRPRAGGGREGKAIEQNLAVHNKLMQDYIKQGMSKEKASKVAFNDMEKMKPKEFKKVLASIKEEVELDERNYRKEYDNYHSRPEQIARRSSRNQARRIMGDKTKIDMDVGHKDNDPMNNDPKNLRNEDPSKNRREPRLREDSVYLQMPWFKKAKDFLFTKTHSKGMNKLALAVAREVAKEQQAGKKPKIMPIIHDIAKIVHGVSDRMLRDYVNDLVAKGKLPKELKAEYEPQNETMSFKQFVNIIQMNEKLSKDADAGEYIKDFEKSDAPQFKGKSKEKRKKMAIAAYLSKQREENVQQDSEIGDREGTQPAKYHKGLAPSTKKKRDAHFKAKKSGLAPGDAKAETKPSVHTKKFKQMYGETVELDENEGLKNKAKKSGMPYGVLKKVYDRGMAAYKTGHRPGTTPQQWAMARVNSFVTKSSGTWGGADKDLAKQVKEENELNEWGEITEKDDKSGKELNNPTKGDIKKYKVYVRNDKGNVVKVEFGDPNMEIKRDDPARKKSFRARHNCANPGPKWKARYWSCKFWSSKSVTDLMKG